MSEDQQVNYFKPTVKDTFKHTFVELAAVSGCSKTPSTPTPKMGTPQPTTPSTHNPFDLQNSTHDRDDQNQNLLNNI